MGQKIKDLWEKIKKFFSQIDTMYHIEANQLITLYSTAVGIFIMPKWWALVVANVIAVIVSGLKELYDYKHPDKHSFEKKDLVSDALGIISIDIALICLFASI